MDNNSQEKVDHEASDSAEVRHSALLFREFQAGVDGAASEIFDRYVARLVALARSRFNRGMQGRIDPEDIVHSAYRSFFVRAAKGDFELQQPGDLWRLLAQITLNKVRKQAERQTAIRRDYRKEIVDPEQSHAAPEATPEDAVALVEQVQLITEQLSNDERAVLNAFLSGDSEEAIAAELAKSPRTIRRTLARIRSIAERELVESRLHSGDQHQVIPPLANPLPYSDFRLEQLIGAGGMGKVYRATRLSTGKRVAVKALRKDRQEDTRAVRQFLHEAEVLKELHHPGIIDLHGIGRFPSGGYFIVMDWVHGADLQTAIDKRSIAPNEALRIIKSVAKAISHSHTAGVIHCDLKPANILIGNDGRVIVTDFGFAQIITGSPRKSAVGGTLGYLAPELIQGSSPPTPAADIYSLGRILERLIPQDSSMQDLVNCCVAKSQRVRPSSASAFLEQLRRLGA